VSPLGAAWEEPARQNLSGALQRLEKELKALEASATATAGTGDSA